MNPDMLANKGTIYIIKNNDNCLDIEQCLFEAFLTCGQTNMYTFKLSDIDTIDACENETKMSTPLTVQDSHTDAESEYCKVHATVKSTLNEKSTVSKTKNNNNGKTASSINLIFSNSLANTTS